MLVLRRIKVRKYLNQQKFKNIGKKIEIQNQPPGDRKVVHVILFMQKEF